MPFLWLHSIEPHSASYLLQRDGLIQGFVGFSGRGNLQDQCREQPWKTCERSVEQRNCACWHWPSLPCWSDQGTLVYNTFNPLMTFFASFFFPSSDLSDVLDTGAILLSPIYLMVFVDFIDWWVRFFWQAKKEHKLLICYDACIHAGLVPGATTRGFRCVDTRASHELSHWGRMRVACESFATQSKCSSWLDCKLDGRCCPRRSPQQNECSQYSHGFCSKHDAGWSSILFTS